MEKKNMVLLTVIAVATLLTAVAGATFSYFTASVTTTNDSNNKTSVTTETLTSAVMDYGSKIEDVDKFPGYHNARTVTVEGKGKDANSQPTYARITVTNTGLNAFANGEGNDVTWALYQVKNEDAIEIGCKNKYTTEAVVNAETGVNETHFFIADPECSEDLTSIEGTTPVIAKNSLASGTVDIKVGPGTKSTYYLVVDYANNKNQSAVASGENTVSQEGQTFTFDLKFTAIAESAFTGTHEGNAVAAIN